MTFSIANDINGYNDAKSRALLLLCHDLRTYSYNDVSAGDYRYMGDSLVGEWGDNQESQGLLPNKNRVKVR